MPQIFISFFVTFVVFSTLDCFIARRWTASASIVPRLLITAIVFGFFLTATGKAETAALLCCAASTLLALGSSIKERILGEPLVFSDLAVFASFIRYPRFYIDALSLPARISISSLIIFCAYFVPKGVVPDLSTRAFGISFTLAGLIFFSAGMKLFWRRSLMPRPALTADVRSYGLLPTLVIYYLRWMSEPTPLPQAPFKVEELGDVEIVCIIQCESFADPKDLSSDLPVPDMPAFNRMMETASQSGKLLVEHFGAYTMRSEYGVLFGRTQESLGFRRYDPYLTAQSELSFSLANRVAPFFTQKAFIHPHDLRFYGRDHLMPAAGFDEIIGPQSFSREDLCGRYVGDCALAGKISGILKKNDHERSLIYSVTMENHGPWSAEEPGSGSPYATYCKHLQSADRMLSILDEALSNSGKKALFVFYGDHRPSIPRVVVPTEERQTPYFIKQYGNRTTDEKRQVDLTPSQLHHEILNFLRKKISITCKLS